MVVIIQNGRLRRLRWRLRLRRRRRSLGRRYVCRQALIRKAAEHQERHLTRRLLKHPEHVCPRPGLAWIKEQNRCVCVPPRVGVCLAATAAGAPRAAAAAAPTTNAAAAAVLLECEALVAFPCTGQIAVAHIPSLNLDYVGRRGVGPVDVCDAERCGCRHSLRKGQPLKPPPQLSFASLEVAAYEQLQIVVCAATELLPQRNAHSQRRNRHAVPHVR